MTNTTHWPQDIHNMHTKFGVREVIQKLPKEKLEAFLNFRLDFLQEELNEAKKAKTADDVVDAMIDLCVVAIGTLDAFQVNAQEAWNRVHTANMAKEPGIKPGRPNPLGLPDLIKPTGWTAPTHVDNVGLLANIFDGLDRPLKYIKRVDYSYPQNDHEPCSATVTYLDDTTEVFSDEKSLIDIQNQIHYQTNGNYP